MISKRFIDLHVIHYLMNLFLHIMSTGYIYLNMIHYLILLFTSYFLCDSFLYMCDVYMIHLITGDFKMIHYMSHLITRDSLHEAFFYT